MKSTPASRYNAKVRREENNKKIANRKHSKIARASRKKNRR